MLLENSRENEHSCCEIINWKWLGYWTLCEILAFIILKSRENNSNTVWEIQKYWERNLKIKSNWKFVKPMFSVIVAFLFVSFECVLCKVSVDIEFYGCTTRRLNLGNCTKWVCKKIQLNIAAEESSVYCDKRLMLKWIINKTRKQQIIHNEFVRKYSLILQQKNLLCIVIKG